MADDPPPPMKKFRMSSVNGTMFRITGTMRFGSPRVQQDWDSYVQTEAAPILRVCQLLVQQALDGTQRSFGFQMALRAINWYADAVSDTDEETQLIKCVTAIESLVLPAKRAARAAFLIRGALLAQRNGLSVEECARVAETIYKTRSDIAHGNIESLGLRSADLSTDALCFTRRTVLQFLAICSRLKPLGPNGVGTRKDMLGFYQQVQGQFPAEISSVVAFYDLVKPWKDLQAQS